MIIGFIFIIAIYGLITSNNLVRKLMCLNIIEGMLILTFLTAGYYEDMVAPIITLDSLYNYVDPIPQALMLTAIVISVCFNSLAAVFIVKLHHKKGSVEINDLIELLMEEDNNDGLQ